MSVLTDSIIWYFFIYSIIGYLCEILYCSVGAKRFVNRGFLHGPYIPVYGFGGLATAMLLSSFASNAVLVFIGALVITSVIEYVAGFLLERLFHIRLWDYSRRRLHIRGRVCLLNSILFGLLSLLVVYGIHPFLQEVVSNLPERLLSGGASVMLLTLGVDTTASILSMAAFTDRLQRIKRLKSMLEPRIELLAQGRQRLVEALDAEVARVAEQLRRSGNRILDAFPGIGSEELDMPLKVIRDMIEKRRERRRSIDRHDNVRSDT